MDITITLLYQPIFNLIIVFYRLFGENLGLAIIAIGIFSRLITLPIMIRQRQTMVRSREFSDKMKTIKEKHKNNKEQQDKELMALQSEYLPSQLAGCLPIILQLIFFINIYQVIINLVERGATAFNEMAYSFIPAFNEGYQLNYSFLGFDLSKHPADFVSGDFLSFLPYIILMVLVGVTQYYSMKISMNANKQNNPKLEEPKKKNKNKKLGKDNPATEDFSEIMQKSTQQTMVLFPILYTFLSYQFRAGLSLYWIIQSGFVIIQQLFIVWLEKRRISKAQEPVVEVKAN